MDVDGERGQGEGEGGEVTDWSEVRRSAECRSMSSSSSVGLSSVDCLSHGASLWHSVIAVPNDIRSC